MSEADTTYFDLAVIGRGMAGMAASLFAAGRGVSTIQVGRTGELIFAGGLMDLLGIHPVEEQKMWKNPWDALEALCRDIPNHPYARIKPGDIDAAFKEVLTFLEHEGLPYYNRKTVNLNLFTPIGTIKPTYCVPQTMYRGVAAFEKKCPCLLVDFHGLTDFSARQLEATLKAQWPDLRAERISFPGMSREGELATGEILAQTLEIPKNLENLAQSISPLIKNAEAVGLPALLGMHKSIQTVSFLEEKIGIPVFEIPTFPVSVPGLRLNDAFTHGLSTMGVRQFSQSRVLDVRREKSGDFVLGIGYKTIDRTIRAGGVLLASGRFWGGGLYAGRKQIRETVFDLPVTQPPTRTDWHHKDFLDPKGHPVNRAGLEVDDDFRPLDRKGRTAFENLFAAGSILAHQDWMRMKCGSGVAIASAYAAVNAFLGLS